VTSRRERIARFFRELRRRRVIRVGVAYVLVGWFVIQVAATTFPYLDLPDWLVTAVIALVGMGLPMAIALSWAYDITPEGVQRTASLDDDPTPTGGADATAWPGAGDTAGPDAGVPSAGATGPASAAKPAGAAGSAGAQPDPGGHRPHPPPDGRIRLIALPFRMLRPDPETDFLAFSLPDAVTSSLAGIGSVVVRSQLAAMRYAGETPDLQELGARMQVDVVLNGTLLRIGERIGITAQLTDVREGTLLWSETAQVELGDLFQIQDQLTRRIVDSLRLPLTDRERRIMDRDVPADERAYELYLRANGVAYEAGRWETARDLYLESVGIDPGYAPAWARLARCYRLIAKYSADRQTADRLMADSVAAFERALALNPDLSLAHNLYAQLEVDLGRAESAMTRLLGRARDNPNDAQIYAGLVHACRFLGLLDESLAAHQVARRLDPQIPTSVSHTYWMLGQYERVLDHTYGDIGYVAGVALASLGRDDEAVSELRRAEQSIDAASLIRPYIASLRSLLEGDRAGAVEALDRAREGPYDGEAIYYLARSYARLGERDRALAALETTVERGFVCAPLFGRDPWLDSVRDDARFLRLVERAEGAHRRARLAFADAGGDAALAGPALTSYTARA
jgi:eukaryotic-like serine/threonine-protein kinase